MKFSWDYSSEVEVFIIFMSLGRQREAIMLYFKVLPHTRMEIYNVCSLSCQDSIIWST